VPGGETEALARLERTVVMRGEWVRGFSKPSTRPTTVEADTTVLSPYMKFGCLSARVFLQALRRIAASTPKGAACTSPPVSLEGQLLWREFFTHTSFCYENFDRMAGNAICKQIPWEASEEALRAWKEGRTGYPWIDACMRQLRVTGWLHHLQRHSVACFLTRGDLYLSWEEGMRVFDLWLVDADWALNAGNWMWLSASAFYYQYYRIYSPVAFPKSTDPSGALVRRWVPELAKFPNKYIYEPWLAPPDKQREWGCVVGEHYPHRIVIHEDVRERNLARHAAAYGEAARAAGTKRPRPERDEEEE
jgi:cryptochrome